MSYSKVQFISWELYTGPVKPASGPASYPGIQNSQDKRLDTLSQCKDIEARIAFTANALEAAHSKADPGATTLKVFLAPEFLYRGAGGAYLHDLINGWEAAAAPELGLTAPFNAKWNGLFGGLQALVANDKYNDWVIVFGTAISASFPSFKDPLSNKYWLDNTKVATAYNTALIQLGGSANTAVNYASRKHYQSNIDFIAYHAGNTNTKFQVGNILPLDPKALIPADVFGELEGSAGFNLAPVVGADGRTIDFGIEICLDHARSNNGVNQWGRLRTANQNVRIQLVPSGGMSLVDASIRLQPNGAAGASPHSYAFNVDGLNNLSPASAGSHTQIWNAGNNGAAVPLANKLYTASSGAALAHTQVVPVAGSVTTPNAGTVAAATLWQKGAGAVRVVDPLPL
ncbi:MAG: hypothetical protein P0Y53_17790 [Candidatus Pseudobacter hemicellulosilyticus]|uniref:Uncharacterized protein n=1 Tax=Candidatus Pseudobacter hemicellulosilyticus TaxID=3121375 RepID=A0AAJ6BGN8_9BACT|nr:MAG: hypothetical protein P0Y53_17790 [Pseudobacter sp.]